ncbi:MAG: ATP-binding protein [Burkholderiales bacterium]
MQCGNCDHENTEAARFCQECGHILDRACTNCGHRQPAAAKFCNQCGQRAGAPASTVASHGTPPANPVATGERRQATVLFSDLSGYTAMNERLDPEEVRRIVGRIKSESVRIVENHGGIVNQFVGDEIMALFGIPVAHEDDPVRAVRAATELHDLVRAMSPEVAPRIGAPLRLHTGISTGLIVTGTEDRRDGTYGVTGDAVNTGARLASQAESDQILVSEETQRLIADFFQIKPLAPVELKGKSGRVTPYLVTDRTGISSRFEAAAQRGFTQYSGRQSELSALQNALQRMRSGKGQFVTVMGEPGIGKSRLLFEFRHSLQADEVTVMEGRCQIYGQNTPYLPLVDALRRKLRINEVRDAAALHDHVVTVVRSISQDIENFLPQYLHLLSIPSQTYSLPAPLQGDALRRSFEEAFAAIVTLASKQKPLLLVLEDWHWADDASDASLKHLAALVPYHPLHVIVTYRPDYDRKWSNPENYTPLVLQPLGEAETAEMLRSVWKAQLLPEGLAAQIHSRTDGNALFNEEVARALLEGEKIKVEGDRAVLTTGIGTLRLPDSVHAVIRARVDRLDPEPREVLRLASVIGREFTRPLLERLHPEPSRLPGALEILIRQDLIHPLRVVPEAAYLFKHALIQDVVYETLLLSQRKSLHERIGMSIETMSVQRIEQHYETLAEHYAKSDNLEKAIEYLEKAGDKAASLFLVVKTMQRFREALAILDSMTPSPDIQRRRIDLSLKWSLFGSFFPVREDVAMMATAVRYARELGDQARLAYSMFWLGRVHYYLSDAEDAKRLFQQCSQWCESSGDRTLTALLNNSYGRVILFSNDLTTCRKLLVEAIPLAEDQGLVFEHALSRFYLGLAQVWQGDTDEGIQNAISALNIAKSASNRFMEAWCTFILGYTHFIVGNWPDAYRFTQLGHEIAAEIGAESPAYQGLVGAGASRFFLGKGIAVLEDCRRGIAGILSTEAKFILTVWGPFCAEMHALAGDVAAAQRYVEISRQVIRPGWKIGAFILPRVEATIAAQLSDPDWSAVERHIETGNAESEECGVKPNLALNFFRHAEILHKKGDFGRALEELAKAQALFPTMNMTWWSEQAANLQERIQRRDAFKWFAPNVDASPHQE